MRTKGKITSWNDDRGFGFITPLDGGKQLFIHIKAFKNKSRRPKINEIVTYASSTDRRGRACAIQATLAGDKLTIKNKRKNNPLHIAVSVVFLLIVGLSVLLQKLPVIILVFYTLISMFTYIFYAIDKKAAKDGSWRTKENTLHLLAIAGGWPGALIAQQTLRHKSKKELFRIVFWITVLLNCSIYFWLFTPTGSSTLNSVMSSIL